VYPIEDYGVTNLIHDRRGCRFTPGSVTLEWTYRLNANEAWTSQVR